MSEHTTENARDSGECWRHGYGHREYVCRCVPVDEFDSGLEPNQRSSSQVRSSVSAAIAEEQFGLPSSALADSLSSARSASPSASSSSMDAMASDPTPGSRR